MKLAEHIIEPKTLIVLWQAIDKHLNKTAGDRYIVGEVFNEGANSKLHYFDNEDTKHAVEKGFKGLTTYPFEPNKVYNGSVERVLSKRLPPDSRRDYVDFLTAFRISPKAAAKISPLGLLAYTTGNLTGDGFAFLPSFEGVTPPIEFTFEVVGFRHSEGFNIKPLSSLQGAEVSFTEESTNQFGDAVAVFYNGKKLGYAPKGVNKAIKQLKAKYSVKASIERINGTTERPNLLVFVEVR